MELASLVENLSELNIAIFGKGRITLIFLNLR